MLNSGSIVADVQMLANSVASMMVSMSLSVTYSKQTLSNWDSQFLIFKFDYCPNCQQFNFIIQTVIQIRITKERNIPFIIKFEQK